MAFDLAVAVLASVVVVGTFDVDPGRTMAGVVAVLAPVAASAVLAHGLRAGWMLAGGVLGRYALGLSHVGPDLGWVYPAPSLPVVVAGAALLAVPLGSLGVGLRGLTTGPGPHRRLLDDPDRTTSVVVVSATVGGVLFVAGLPRTLWILPSWSLARASAGGVVAIGTAFVGGHYRPNTRKTGSRVVALFVLAVSGLIVAAVGPR